MADFDLKNQILAWINDAKLVFERNCHQSRHPASSSKASYLDGCWQESHTKRADQQTLNPRSAWNFWLFKVSSGKFMENCTFCCQDWGFEIQLKRFIVDFDCTSKHLKRKKCSHQNPNPIFSWTSSLVTAFVQTCTNSFDGAALSQRLRTLKDFPFETFVLPCIFPFLSGGGPFKHYPLPYQLHTAERERRTLMRLDLYKVLIWKNKFIQSFRTIFLSKKTGQWNRMMTLVCVFGSMLCGLHKVLSTENTAQIEYSENMGFRFLTWSGVLSGSLGRRHSMCGAHFQYHLWIFT